MLKCSCPLQFVTAVLDALVKFYNVNTKTILISTY